MFRSRKAAITCFLGFMVAMGITTSSALDALAATPKHTLNSIHTFLGGWGPDGEYPQSLGSSLIIGPKTGLLYGVTNHGSGLTDWYCASGCGEIFQLIYNSETKQWTNKIIYNFCKASGCSDGANPVGGLIADTKNNFYGTTSSGGKYNYGTAFELVHNGLYSKWTLKTVYDFCSKSGPPDCTDGSGLVSTLTYKGETSGSTYDGTSPLYGTTSAGGDYSNGVAFQLTYTSGGKRKENVIYSFCSTTNCPDGAAPTGGIVEPSGGHFYGTTLMGGSKNEGILFEILPAKGGGYEETVLHSFCEESNCADGGSPNGDLVTSPTGSLYGATYGGGQFSRGTIFRYNKTKGYSVLHSFCDDGKTCFEGTQPNSIIMSASGNIFGSNQYGGRCLYDGTLFSMDMRGNISVLHSFCDSLDGAGPESGVTLDSSGNVYGTTYYGGYDSNDHFWNLGTVFELVP